jgi:hypothetical protein
LLAQGHLLENDDRVEILQRVLFSRGNITLKFRKQIMKDDSNIEDILILSAEDIKRKDK